MQAGHLPEQDAAARGGGVGRRAAGRADRAAGADSQRRPARARDAVQALTLLSLRALGVVDARARGLVVQTALPAAEEA